MQHVTLCSRFKPCSAEPPDTSMKELPSQLINLAITSANTLIGLFLVAARHLSLHHFDQKAEVIELTLKYKIAYAKHIAEALELTASGSSISDSTVALALFLAQDEVKSLPLFSHRRDNADHGQVLLDDEVSSRRHIQGARDMLNHTWTSRTCSSGDFLCKVVYHGIPMS